MTMSHPNPDSASSAPRLNAFNAAWRRAAGHILNSNGRGDGPPDLDELWRDFNRKLSGLFGGKGGGQRGGGSGDGGNNNPANRHISIWRQLPAHFCFEYTNGPSKL